MLAIRVIDEEKFQFYAPEGCPEPKISDLLREEIFNQLELLENTLTLENTNTTSNIDQIFKFIFILFGIIFSILSILLIIYSYKGAKILDDHDSQTYKLKERSNNYHSRAYEKNILDENIILLIEDRNSIINYIETEKLNSLGKSVKLALKKEKIIFSKKNISTILTNIDILKINKILSRNKHLKILQLQDSRSKSNKLSFDLLVTMGLILREYSLNVTDYSQEDLFTYSKLIRYWTIYNYIGGTFLIISGTHLHGISIIWYEAKLIVEHISLSNQYIPFHQLIQNGEVLVTNVFKYTIYYFNMSNCLIIHEKILFGTIFLIDYNPLNPSQLEIFASDENNSQFMHYDYKTSEFTNNLTVTVKYNKLISQVLKSKQLPKLIIRRVEILTGYSIETGLKLQEYDTSSIYLHFSSSLTEFPNNKLGYISSFSSLIILDLDNLTFIEDYAKNIGGDQYSFRKIYPLSPDRNIFLATNSEKYWIIKFDTKTILWEGNQQSYHVLITTVTQVMGNIFMYSDSNSKLWIIDIDNNFHSLFIDIEQYEKEEFNYYYYNSYISSISVIERDSSPTYTLNQI